MSQLRLPREPMKLDESVIQRPKDMLRAFVLQAELGGLDDQQRRRHRGESSGVARAEGGGVRR